MGRDSDDDRPKKSWREIDRGRDSSSHRREERPADQIRPSSQAYRSYKSQLDKLFDGRGSLPDAMKAKLEESGVGAAAKSRRAALDAIRGATSPGGVVEALNAYREEHGFPEDEEILARLLELDDGPIVLEAMQTIGRLHQEGLLKKAKSLKGRIKTAQMTVDDDDVFALAKQLLGALK